jgi:hypothetical protein
MVEYDSRASVRSISVMVYEYMVYEYMVYEYMVYEYMVYEYMVYEYMVYEWMVYECMVYENMVTTVYTNITYGQSPAVCALAPPSLSDGWVSSASRESDSSKSEQVKQCMDLEHFIH